MAASPKILWLVRHGETTRSAAGEIAGWSNPPLTEKGRAQALALAPRLRGEDFKAVYSSDLKRCISTAKLARGEAKIDARLRELNFGVYEKKAFHEVDPEIFAQVAEFRSFEIPGGESLKNFEARLHEAIAEMPTGKLLLFVHGGVIRALCRRAGLDRFVGTGSLVGLDYDKEKLLFIEEDAT